MIFYTVALGMALGNEKAHLILFFCASNSFHLFIELQQQRIFKSEAQNSVAPNASFLLLTFFTVPNIPITNRESGIMTRALPTTTEKGILFFHQSETYELICNYASCWWITHPHQRTVVRNNWPVAMYISDAFTDNICKECGNNTYINLISNIMFWHFM